VAERDEKREVGVAVAGGFEHAVKDGLHAFPERVAPRFDDHAAADFGIFGEVGGFDDLLVPLGKILVAAWRNGGFFAHTKDRNRPL